MKKVSKVLFFWVIILLACSAVQTGLANDIRKSTSKSSTGTIAASSPECLKKSNGDFGKSVKWLKSNRARVVYGVNQAADVDTFAKAGFNLMAPCGFNAAPGSPFNSTQTKVLNVAKRCKELGLKVMPYFWFTPDFFCHRHYKGASKAKVRDWYVTPDGKQNNTPCPIDETYWNHYLFKGLLETAKLSKEYPIVALAVDFELYATSHSEGYDKHCFCNRCWNSFCKLKGIEANVAAPAERYRYLTECGKFKSYSNWQRSEVRKLGANLAKAIHKINPDLALAYVCYDRRWFPYEVVRGFASDSTPAMVFGEVQSYSIGYSPMVDRLYKNLKDENTLYYPGLWISFWNPVAILTEHSYQLGMHSNGWWLAPQGNRI